MRAQMTATDKLISVAAICALKLVSGQSKPVMHNNVHVHATHPMILMIFILFMGVLDSYNSIFLIVTIKDILLYNRRSPC